MAKTRRPAPSAAYIRALASRLELDFSKQDDQITLMREVRLMQNTVPIHPDLARDVYVEVHDPTVGDEIARVHATLSLNPPKCEVVPASPADQAMSNATLREQWTEEVLTEAGRDEFGVDTFRAVMDAAIADGGGWSKLMHKSATWEARSKLRIKDYDDDVDEETGAVKRSAAAKFNEAVEDAKRAAGPPFAWRAVDVATIYPVWDGTQLAEMVEVSHRRLVDLVGRYGIGMDRDGRLMQAMGPPLSEIEADKLGTSVKFIEHWTEEWVSYYVEGPAVRDHANHLIARQFRHGYGRVPYFFVPGLMPNHWRGRKVGWGVSMNKLALVQYREVLLTLLSIAAARDVASPLVEERTDLAADFQGEDDRPDDVEYLPLNALVHLPPNTKLSPLFSRPVAQSFNQVLALVNTMIDRVDSPRIASQIGGGVEGAGFAISQILTEAKTKHSPFMVHAERMLAELTEFLWHIVRTKVKETVWVEQSYNDEGRQVHRGWLAVGPDELKAAARVRWHLDPEQPSAKIIESRYWHERLEAGTAHMDQAVTAMGDNPDEIREGKARDRIRNTDWYIKTEDQLALQEIGRGDLAELAMQVAQTGLLPGMEGSVPQGVDPAMGGSGGIVPDMANLQVAPNGAGAAGISPQTAGIGPGAVLPQQGGQAMVQRIGP